MNEIAVLDHLAELCATNATASDLCRALVHSQTTGADALGAAVYLTTTSGDLEMFGSYGRSPTLLEDSSIWAINPIALSVREQKAQVGHMENGHGDTLPTSAIPILKGSSPIGALAMMRTNEKNALANLLSELGLRSLGNTLGVWVDSLGFRPNTGPITLQNEPELTQRQLEILRHMASGRTNAQIAAELILSESSIRQETVRIYRALGVGTRAEASRKGLNLGLIEKVAH